MAAAVAIKDKRIEVPEGMKGPLVVSAIVHVVLVVVAITGLPYFKRDPEPMMESIPVEILPIADIRQTNRKPVEAPPAPEPEKLEKPPEKKPAPPKVEEVKPPEPPKPPKAEKPKPKAKPVTPPPPDESALEKAKEEPKPEEKKPPEPVEAKEKAEEKQEQTQDFSKLLKNLQDSKPETDETLPESKDAAPQTPSPQAALGETMTMTEYDALSQQLARCWSIQAGARYAEDLVVKVRLSVSPDRRVTSAVIQDQWRYSQDSYFRAAADSAIRAVHSPQCEILQLPPDKYEVWKDIIVTFDPTEML